MHTVEELKGKLFTFTMVFLTIIKIFHDGTI